MRSEIQAALVAMTSGFLALAHPPLAVADDGTELLREQQERLFELDFAVKEAELLQRLCSLRPGASECLALRSPEPGAGGNDSSGTGRNPAEARLPQEYHVVEIFGSNDNLTAVLRDSTGARHVARRGSVLAGGVEVARVGRTIVVLVSDDEQFALELGH